MSFFDINLQALAARHPSLLQHLEPEIQLFKRRQGKSESKNRASLSSFEIPNSQLIFILGLGQGDQLKTLLVNRTLHHFGIFVAEPRPQKFLLSLVEKNWSKEFADASIHWCIGESDLEVRNQLQDFFLKFSTAQTLGFIPDPESLERDPAYFQKLAESIRLIRQQSSYQCGNNVDDSLKGFIHTLKNFKRAFYNPGLLRFENKFHGKVALSIAAGPSLNEHWNLLRKLSGKIPIFACDTLLKPFHEQKIECDFMTAIERDSVVTDFFRGIPVPERTSLVAPPLLLSDSFDAFQGDHIFYAQTMGYTPYLGLDRIGMFFPSWSAGNMNVNLAVYMGFSTVILVGHDLAYAPGTQESHVKGTIDRDRERSRSEKEILEAAWGGGGRKVVTQDGSGEVWTHLQWNMFRHGIENTVLNSSQTKFINTSRYGAKIAGTELLTLEEALKRHHREDFDIYPVRRKILAPSPPSDEDWRQVGEKAARAIHAISSYYLRGEKMLEKLETWNAQMTAGQVFSIEKLNELLDEVLGLKISSYEDDEAFKQIATSILNPEQIEFERTLNSMVATYTKDDELKRDILLKHREFFQRWMKVLPQILEALNEFVRVEKFQAQPLESLQSEYPTRQK